MRTLESNDGGKTFWTIEVIEGVEVKRRVDPRQFICPPKCAGPWIDGRIARPVDASLLYRWQHDVETTRDRPVRSGTEDR